MKEFIICLTVCLYTMSRSEKDAVMTMRYMLTDHLFLRSTEMNYFTSLTTLFYSVCDPDHKIQ